MRVAVSGSIAEDYLMSFPGTFEEAIVPDELDRLSLSFLVEDLEVRRGGVGANICFGMGLLGSDPLLVGAAGRDFRDGYERWLTAHGVDTSAVRISTEQHTARFVCTTDGEDNQIASFYAGAMAEAGRVDIAEVAADRDLGLVVVAPNDPDAMLSHRRGAERAGLPVMADPSQQLARLEPERIRRLVDGAAYLTSNDYEAALLHDKTGWSPRQVLDRVGVRVTTLGEQGCRIERGPDEVVEVPAVPAEDPVDPTGIGDGFRAGFLAARAAGRSLRRSAQLGCLLATHVLESSGPQTTELPHDAALERLRAAYGDRDATELAPLLAPLAGEPVPA